MTPSIASTDTKKRRVLARRKARKYLRMTSKEPSINEEYKELQHQDENSSTSIAITDTKKRRVLVRRKARKYLRMTSEEPSINEEYKESQHQDRINTASTASIKNSLIHEHKKAGNRLRKNKHTSTNKKSHKQSKDIESVYHKTRKRIYDKAVAKCSETNRRMTWHYYKEVYKKNAII